MSRPRPRRLRRHTSPAPSLFDAFDIETLRAILQARIDYLRAVQDWKRRGRPECGPDYPNPPDEVWAIDFTNA